MRAIVLSGGRRYADPWHRFAETSGRLSEIVRLAGFLADIQDDVDAAIEDAAAAADVALLVVNAGDPWRDGADPDPPSPRATAALRGLLDRGVGVLGMHYSVSSLRDYPEWAAATGAVWLPGVTFHPPEGPTEIRLTGSDLTTGLGDFTVQDERYCRLQRIGDARVVATHEGYGRGPEPAAWI